MGSELQKKQANLYNVQLMNHQFDNKPKPIQQAIVNQPIQRSATFQPQQTVYGGNTSPRAQTMYNPQVQNMYQPQPQQQQNVIYAQPQQQQQRVVYQQPVQQQ